MTNEAYILPNGKQVVKAVYTPLHSALHEYANNPLIEALPPLFSKEEVYRYLTPHFHYNEEERKADRVVRLHCVYRLFDYFQPFREHYELEQKISVAIRRGYIHRNPCDPSYAQGLQESYNCLKSGMITNGQTTYNSALGFSLLGLSGTGKTSSIRRILAPYPQVIAHTDYHGHKLNLLQLTWLKLDCSHDGSLKGIGENFFEQIDNLLGTNYFSEFANNEYKARRIVPALRHVARAHSLGLLIVDEIQNLSHLKSGGPKKILQFFVQLRNEIGIPVILVGTPTARSILQSNFTTARRGCSQGHIPWCELPPGLKWEEFVKGFWDRQWTSTKTELTPELIDKLYNESQGIPDTALKLYGLAQCKAIASGKNEQITPKLIENVARTSLAPLQPWLEALRNKDYELLSRFEDIEIDFFTHFNECLNKISASSEISESCSSEQVLITQIVNNMSAVGIDATRAFNIANDLLEANKERDVILLTQEAVKIAFDLDIAQKKVSKTKASSKKKQSTYSGDDFRLIGEKAKVAKQPLARVIEEAGFNRDPLIELVLEV